MSSPPPSVIHTPSFPSRSSSRARKPIERLGEFIDSEEIKAHDEYPEGIDDWRNEVDEDEEEEEEDDDFNMDRADDEDEDGEPDAGEVEEEDGEEGTASNGKSKGNGKKRKAKADKEPKEPKAKRAKKHIPVEIKSKAKPEKQGLLNMKSTVKTTSTKPAALAIKPKNISVGASAASRESAGLSIKKTMVAAPEESEDAVAAENEAIEENEDDDEERDEAPVDEPVKTVAKPKKGGVLLGPAKNVSNSKTKSATTASLANAAKGGFKGLQPKSAMPKSIPKAANKTPAVRKAIKIKGAKVVDAEPEAIDDQAIDIELEEEECGEHEEGDSEETDRKAAAHPFKGKVTVASRTVKPRKRQPGPDVAEDEAACPAEDNNKGDVAQEEEEEDKTPKKPSSRTSKPKKQVKRELLPPAEIVETQEELADGIERGREDDEESLTVKNLKKGTQKARSMSVPQAADNGDETTAEAEIAEEDDVPPMSPTQRTTAPASSQSSAVSAPSPSPKITTATKLAILSALSSTAYNSTLQTAFQRLSTKHGETGAKISRHWREVLATDLQGAFGGPAKSGKAAKAINKELRKEIWEVVVKGYEKADWAGLEQETGVDTTKLKRHLRDVMRKEGLKAIERG